jgi:hypothetical protein
MSRVLARGSPALLSQVQSFVRARAMVAARTQRRIGLSRYDINIRNSLSPDPQRAGSAREVAIR